MSIQKLIMEAIESDDYNQDRIESNVIKNYQSLSKSKKELIDNFMIDLTGFSLSHFIEQRDNIIIKDWTGNVLFEGNYNSKKIDKVLNANKCKCKQCKAYRKGKGDDYCSNSESTGYSGDFSITWIDENRNDNVYEFINY